MSKIVPYKHKILKIRDKQRIILEDPNRFVITFCGRRFGKTYLACAKALQQLQINDSLVSYLAPTNAQAKKIFWKVLKRSIPYDWIQKIEETTPYCIKLINGSEISLYGAEAHDRIRGNANDLVICDEIQDYCEDAWYDSIFPTLSDRQGKAFLIGTPKGKAHFSYELTTNSDYSFHHYTTIDGGWVKQSEYELARKMLPEREFKQEYEASFETSGLQVYYTYSDTNINKSIEFNNQRETYLCFDFNVNPMSCIILQRLEEHKYCAVKEFILRNSNTDDCCQAVEHYLKLNNFNNTLIVTGDFSGNSKKTSSTASRSDYGIIDTYFKNYPNYNIRTRPTPSIKDRVTSLNALFRNADNEIRMIINTIQCPKLHKDFLLVEWNESEFSLSTKNKDLTHASDALSYFAMNFYPTHTTNYTIT